MFTSFPLESSNFLHLLQLDKIIWQLSHYNVEGVKRNPVIHAEHYKAF